MPEGIRLLARRIVRRLQGERRLHRIGGRRLSDREPKRGWVPALAIALGIAVLDWTTKAIISRSIPLNDLVVVVQGRLAFWHVRNPAMILGLYGDLPLASRKVIAILCGMLAAVLLFEVISRGHRLPPRRRKWVWIFVGFVSGGMIGNLGERAFHWWVTDFISFGWGNLWLPPGNIADLAIFLSIPLAVIVILFELEARASRGEEADPSDADGASLAGGTVQPEA